MKSLLKAAALLVIAMPLFAGDMTTTAAATDAKAAPAADCSTMMGADKDKCMKEMKDSCMKMTDAMKKKDCMDKMDKMMSHKDNGMMNKTAQ